jgi:lipoprotein-releasing system permease protein
LQPESRIQLPLSFEFFIARRVYFGGNIKKKVSAPAIKIAVAGIALGLATMLLAVAVVIGFKQEVGNKVVGLGSHIQVTSLNNSSTFETLPLSIDSHSLTL